MAFKDKVRVEPATRSAVATCMAFKDNRNSYIVHPFDGCLESVDWTTGLESVDWTTGLEFWNGL